MSGLEALNRTILLCRDYVADELTDEQIANAFQSLRVLCMADDVTLSSHSGQTALITLVCLLSRMGMQVGLVLPDAPIIKPQPPVAGAGIGVRTALTSVSERLLPGGSIVRADAGFSPDIAFALGSHDIEFECAHSWRMTGSDWSGAITSSDDNRASWLSEWPIGGMVTALLAANEAFKTAMRRLPLRRALDQIFFEPSLRCSWDFGAIPIPANILDLGRVDAISGGAISQAALYVLARLPLLQMQIRVFDDDLCALSNLNRNMLAIVDDDGYKTDVIAARLPQFNVEPLPRRFMGASDSQVRLASRVLVGVDDIPSRWAVQRDAPGWVGVGGTSHFSMSSSAHQPGEPCSGCLHPVDDLGGANPIPTVSFVSYWAGLSLAVRLIREAVGYPYTADRQHLWLTPLRLDQRYAATWSPIPPRKDCPVRCMVSQSMM